VRAPIDEARPESRRHPAVPENFRNPPQTTLWRVFFLAEGSYAIEQVAVPVAWY